jgi:hypothetical protein
MISRHWKFLLSLVAIFVIGAATGSIMTRRLAPTTNTPTEKKWSTATLEEYRTRLDLNHEQVVRIQPAFVQASAELRRIRSEAVTNIHAVIKTMNTQIAQELTEPQRVKLRILVQERKHAH